MSMDDREIRERANDLHHYLVGVDDREKAAEKRIADLIRAQENNTKLIIAALERGFRQIADTLAQRR